MRRSSWGCVVVFDSHRAMEVGVSTTTESRGSYGEITLSPNSAGVTPVGRLARHCGFVALLQAMKEFISKHSEAKPYGQN